MTDAQTSRRLESPADTPNRSAIYALYAGSGRSHYVVCVGIAGKLRQRLIQHFVRRDSSVTTGVSAVSLNPDLITDIEWWENRAFDECAALEAAELIAFEQMEPALRSRGAARQEARQSAAKPEFRQQMMELLSGPPTGTVTGSVPSPVEIKMA